MKNQNTVKIVVLVIWAITLAYLVARTGFSSTCLGSGLSIQ